MQLRRCYIQVMSFIMLRSSAVVTVSYACVEQHIRIQVIRRPKQSSEALRLRRGNHSVKMAARIVPCTQARQLTLSVNLLDKEAVMS